MKARQDLQSHYNTISKLHLRQLFKEDPGRGERMTAEAEGMFLDYSKNRITRETLDLLPAIGGRMPAPIKNRCHVSRGEDQPYRKPLGVARRATSAQGDTDRRRSQRRRPRCSCGPGKDGRFRSTGSKRLVARPHRKADSERRQYRNRRVGSRARHGIRSAEALQRPVYDVSLRLQH